MAPPVNPTGLTARKDWMASTGKTVVVEGEETRPLQ